MKPLNYPVKPDEQAYMRKRQNQNRVICQNNKAENWMAEKLSKTGYAWTRQAQWGYRLFDFWSHHLGVAVEVDGPEHHKGRDKFRDTYNFRRSGIIVLRVENFDEESAAKAIEDISKSGTWKNRRESMKIKGGKVRGEWRAADSLGDLDAFLPGLDMPKERKK